MEGLSQRGREMRSSIEDFEADTLGVRKRRLKLIQRMGAGFSKRNREPRVSTLAGDGQGGHADGGALEASTNQPDGIVTLPDGSVVFSDRTHCLRLISPGFETVKTVRHCPLFLPCAFREVCEVCVRFA